MGQSRLVRTARGVTREVGWIATHLATYPLGLVAERAPRVRVDAGGRSADELGLLHADVDAASTPILLVHGIIDNRTIFTPLRRELRRRGHHDIRAFDYRPWTADVAATAARLGEAVERLRTATGRDRVHVIGHSLGGLMARYYVQRLGGHERVHTCVTLGTPHGGTELARLGGLLPLVDQLRPGSDLMTELALPAPHVRTRFVAFHSDLDQLMVPRTAAMLGHPDLDVTNVAVHGVGHLSLTNDRAIADRIATLLAAREPVEGPDQSVASGTAAPGPR